MFVNTSFLSCKMGMIIVPVHRAVVRTILWTRNWHRKVAPWIGAASLLFLEEKLEHFFPESILQSSHQMYLFNKQVLNRDHNKYGGNMLNKTLSRAAVQIYPFIHSFIHWRLIYSPLINQLLSTQSSASEIIFCIYLLTSICVIIILAIQPQVPNYSSFFHSWLFKTTSHPEWSFKTVNQIMPFLC